MAGFNPDAYLANKPASGFDPDAYLNARAAAAPLVLESSRTDPALSDLPMPPPPQDTRTGRGGFSGRVRRTLDGNGPPKIPAPTGRQVLNAYGQGATGAVEGVPSGIVGLPGDAESVVRAIGSLGVFGAPVSSDRKDAIFPTSGESADMMFGKAQNRYQSGGRDLGVLAAPSLLGALRTAKIARTKIPSLEQINKNTTNLYTAAKNENVNITPQAWNTFSKDLGYDMTSKETMLTVGNSPAIKALDTIQAETATNAPVTLEKADKIRASMDGYVEEALKSGNKNEARLVILMKDKLDDFLDNLINNPGSYTGDASKAIPILKEARSSAQKGFKANTVQKLIDIAKAQKGGKYDPVLVEKKLRKSFVKLEQDFIKNPSLAKAWTAEERLAIQKIVQGGQTQRFMRHLSKPLPIVGQKGTVVPIIGSGAKRISAASGQKNVRLLNELVRRGGPALRVPGASLKPTARQAALAAALSLNRGQDEQDPNYEDAP